MTSFTLSEQKLNFLAPRANTLWLAALKKKVTIEKSRENLLFKNSVFLVDISFTHTEKKKKINKSF